MPQRDICEIIQHQDYAALRCLVDSHPQSVLQQIRLEENDYLYPLHLAANLGDMTAGELLLDRLETFHIPVDALRDRDNNTAHHLAALNGHRDFVGLLIKHGSNTHVQNALHTLPIHDAAKFGHTSLIRLYIELYGPEMLLITNRYGETPFYRIVSHGHVDSATEIMDIIHYYSLGFADLKRVYTLTTNTGYTAYDFVCWRLLQPFYIKGDNSVLRRKFQLLQDFMIAYGANNHSEQWKRQESDIARAAYNPTAQAEWEMLNRHRDANGSIIAAQAVA